MHARPYPSPIDAEALRRLLADLVRIDSTNPALGSEGDLGGCSGAGERQLADYVAEAMRATGLEVDRWEPAPGRPNVVGVLRGTGDGRSLMWNAHMDTVGTDGMEAPFEPVVREGRLYGRGALDMKGGLAAQLAAAHALARSGVPLAGDLVVAAVADEEHRSLGTEALIDRYRTDGAVVTEPTDLRLALAHKGFVWIDVTTRGRAAHGSRPDEGIDANMHMGRVLARLEALAASLGRRPAHRLVGTPSLHAGQLRGGTAPSVYAARCRLRLERRTVPGESAEEALEEVRQILSALRAQDPAFDAEAQVAFAREPLETAPDAPIVAAVRTGMRDILGEPGPIVGASFWTDAALLSGAGTETVVLGPSGAGLHTTEEWVDLQSVVQLAEVLVSTARRYCT